MLPNKDIKCPARTQHMTETQQKVALGGPKEGLSHISPAKRGWDSLEQSDPSDGEKGQHRRASWGRKHELQPLSQADCPGASACTSQG